MGVCEGVYRSVWVGKYSLASYTLLARLRWVYSNHSILHFCLVSEQKGCSLRD